MRPGLIVPAVLSRKYEIPPGVRVCDRRRMTVNVPGIREEAILHCKRGAIRQVVFGPDTNGVGRTRVRVELGLETVAKRTAGVEVAHRTVGIIQKPLIGNDFDVHGGNQVSGQNLCYADAIVLPGVIAKEIRVIGAPHGVVTVTVTQRQRRQIAKHVLRNRQVVASRVEIALYTAGKTHGHYRVAAQVIHRQRILRTLLGIRACSGNHIDRCGTNHIYVVIGRNRNTLANTLAHQNRWAVNLNAAANILVVQEVGTVIRQHTRDTSLAQAKQRSNCQNAVAVHLRLRQYAN